MNKTKPVAAVLAVSMLISLCGCSNDNKAVLACAEEYAKAISEFDTDELSGCFADDAERELELFEDIYNNKAKLKDAYDVIIDSITYEIDQKSVQSSKKDKTASVDVTFTIVDYKAIYDEVYDDGGTLDDYISALEDDNGDNVMEIDQTISFVYKRDHWLVKDKKFKNLHEIYKFIETIPDFGWGNFNAVSETEFKTAVIAAFSAGKDEIYEDDFSTYREIAYYGYEEAYVSYQKYNDAKDAQTAFSDMYNTLQYDFDLNSNDGSIVHSFTGEDGYILFNNVYTVDNSYSAYGGVYLKGNTIVSAIAIDGSASTNTCIDRFLNEINYPVPG